MFKTYAALLAVAALLPSDYTVNTSNDAADTVEINANPGDLVSINPVTVENARTHWLTPEGFEQFQIDRDSGTLYVAMPKRNLEFTLVIAPNDLDERIQIKRFRLLVGGHPDPDDPDPEPTPDPTPDPEPEPVDEYDGPNTHGVGKIAYRAASEISSDRRILAADLYRVAKERLQGVGGVLFISSPNPDENVFGWLAVMGQEWQLPIDKAIQDRDPAGLKLSDWLKVFDEAIAGIEAVK